MEKLFESINQNPLLYVGAIVLVVVLLVIARTTIIGDSPESFDSTVPDLDRGDCVQLSEFSTNYVNLAEVSCNEGGSDVYRFNGYLNQNQLPGIGCTISFRLAGTVDRFLCLSPR